MSARLETNGVLSSIWVWEALIYDGNLFWWPAIDRNRHLTTDGGNKQKINKKNSVKNSVLRHRNEKRLDSPPPPNRLNPRIRLTHRHTDTPTHTHTHTLKRFRSNRQRWRGCFCSVQCVRVFFFFHSSKVSSIFFCVCFGRIFVCLFVFFSEDGRALLAECRPLLPSGAAFRRAKRRPRKKKGAGGGAKALVGGATPLDDWFHP